MAGAGCIAGEEFGGRGIIVSDWGGGRNIKFSGTGIDDGGVGYSIGGIGWRRGGTDARISRRNKFTIVGMAIFIFTCYAGDPTGSLHEVVPALVGVGAGACGIPVGRGVDVAKFLGAAVRAGVVGDDAPAMGGVEDADDPFLFELRTDS